MKLSLRLRPLLLAGAALSSLFLALPSQAAPRWSKEKAAAWGREKGWLVGCNFGPSTAINQLEMWQADSWDPKTIDRELGWAEDLGFNSIRVFLHNLPYQQDPEGFLKRMDQFLGIADRHKIGVMFVLLDSVWDPYPRSGKQRAPRPHLHNSGWVQAPGREILENPSRHEELKPYVQGVLRRFKTDRRIHAWDLMNEPDNTNGNSYGPLEPKGKPELAFTLLKKVWAWAKEADPDQPLTSAPWAGEWDEQRLKPIDRFMFEESDIITFHMYAPQKETQRRVEQLRRYGRPLLCTEYMARPIGSTFEAVLPYFKDQTVGAYNWGFVAGKTNTIYPWDSWQKQYTGEPPLWFHDLFRADGTVYRPEEVQEIKHLTGKLRCSAVPVRSQPVKAAAR